MFEDKEQKVVQPAWDLFCKGNLRRAEQEATIAARKLKSMAPAPIPDLMILRAFYLCRLGQFQKARTLFGKVLAGRPDDAYAQAGYLLALQDQLVTEGPAMDKSSDDAMLLLGIGTGRSGSTTLTRLLQYQGNCYCTHEHPPRLKWEVDIPRFEFHKHRFSILQKAYTHVGDVSHWWLPYINNIMESYQNIRVIILKREQEATVNSFLRIKGHGRKGSVNHWIDHDGSYWARNIWDECYPAYDVATMKEALEHYWHDYYTAVEPLVQRFPSKIRVFKTEQLEHPDTQKKILSFCGFVQHRLIKNLHLNKDGISDGNVMY